MYRRREYTLRLAARQDADDFHALLGLPEVYRYLSDGVATPLSHVQDWIELSLAEFAESGLGIWFLQDGAGTIVGGVRIEPKNALRLPEITWVLHPDHWGRGLATRMAWTVIQEAFATGRIEEIVAGADKPNTASFAVMRRLGMKFHRDVSYPLGPGAEYILRRADPAPKPPPALIPHLE